MTCTYSVDALPERIASKIEVDANGCWLWTAAKNEHGYAYVKWNGAKRRAHRVVYQILVGEIPSGLQLDHLCRVRHCVNPAHLEPVTCQENILRGDTVAAERAARTHCPRGHALAGANLAPWALKRGTRECLTCKRAWYRAYYARKKALAAQAVRS